MRKTLRKSSGDGRGFTVVEIMIALVIFPIVVIGLTNTYSSVKRSYMQARQLNEIYAVLSACPEIDRALEFSSLTTSTNCYPNNTFQVEHTTVAQTNKYSPTLTVSDTSTLASGDPLQAVPDSKVINISVNVPNTNNVNFKLKMLITRNGIGQL